MKVKILLTLAFLSIMFVALTNSQSQKIDYPEIPTIPYFSADPLTSETKNPSINYNAPLFPSFAYLNAGTPNTGLPYAKIQQPINSGFPFAKIEQPLKSGFPASFFMNLDPSSCCNSELITNGDFQDNKCKRDFCEWNAKNIGQAVPGWTPNPVIEIGRSNYYNPYIGSNTVMELDAVTNTCVDQTFNSCGFGQYELKFDHAARYWRDLKTSSFIVKINGYVVDTFIHTSYNVLTVKRTVKLMIGPNKLTFCGSGAGDRYGAVIDNVSIRCSKN